MGRTDFPIAGIPEISGNVASLNYSICLDLPVQVCNLCGTVWYRTFRVKAPTTVSWTQTHYQAYTRLAPAVSPSPLLPSLLDNSGSPHMKHDYDHMVALLLFVGCLKSQ